MAKKNNTQQATQEKKQETKKPRLTVAILAEQLATLTSVVSELASRIEAPAQAPAQETKAPKTKKAPKTTQSAKVARIPFPEKDVWMSFKALHADEVANLATKKERNKALWKIYVAEQTGTPVPTQEKSTTQKKSTKKQVARPSREEWLSFKAAHAAEVANLATQKERNSKLWAMYVEQAA